MAPIDGDGRPRCALLHYPEHGSVFSTPPASVVAPQFALSPDGRTLAFVATANGRAMLWMRPLNALAARVVPGTEDALYPFWSPDSRSLGFVAQGQLKAVTLGGGPVVRTNVSFDTRGGAWGPDGSQLVTLTPNGGLSLVSTDGSSRPALALNGASGEASHRWPSWLPDGRHFLFMMRHADVRKRGVYLAAVGDETRTRLTDGDWGAAAVDGRLFFLRGRTLMMQTLDVEGRRLTGEAVPLLNDVGTTSTGYAAFSVSRTGTLAYSETWPVQGELIWFGRDGRQLGNPIASRADYVAFDLSPDATRLAISPVDPQTTTGDIWILDLVRQTKTRLTSDAMGDWRPMWSPDGSRILFDSNRSGINSVYAKAANGSHPEELFYEHPESSAMISSDYSRDGRVVLYTNTRSKTSFDLWALFLGPPLSAKPLLQTAFNEYHAVLSPDSRWIAYVSDETGAPQVYVQSFPEGEMRWQVSSQAAPSRSGEPTDRSCIS